MREDVRISQLPAATSLTGSEQVPIVQDGLTKRATPALFVADVDTRLDTVESGAFPSPWRWDDLRVPLSAGRTAGAADPVYDTFTASGELRAWSFINTANRELFFETQLPHDYVLGTELRPHVHWGVKVTRSTGVVRWGLEYALANPGGTFTSTAPIYATYTFDGNQQYKHLITSFTAIDGGTVGSPTFRSSSVLLGRFFRDTTVGSNYADPAFALSFDIHYQRGQLGSVAEFGDV